MMISRENVHKLYLLTCAGLILTGVIMGITSDGYLQLHRLRSFTYQSNLTMVFGFLTMVVLYKNENQLRLYVLSNVLLITTVTGLVYNFVLVPFADAPVFHTDYVNFSTHVLVTLLALLNYFAFEEKGLLRYKHFLTGLIFPIIYWTAFVIIGGNLDYFPYFFMNPYLIGWPLVLVWLWVLLSVFSGLGLMLLLHDRAMGKALKILAARKNISRKIK